MRGAVLVLALMAGAIPAMAGERSAPLSLEAARQIIAGTGWNRGKVFAVGDDRYALGGVTVERHGERVFVLRLIVDPLERRPLERRR